MARKRKAKVMLTLEEQLAAMPRRPIAGLTAEPWMERDVVKAQIEWDRRFKSLKDAIRARDAKKFRESGRDPAGNFSPSPYAERDHVVEIAPKELRSNPNSQLHPKRFTTQRMFDRYLKKKFITPAQHAAAGALWTLHFDLGRVAKTTSGYDPVMVQSSPSMDGRLAKYLDAALQFTRLMNAVPYHFRGVVEAVVIDDRSASDWARSRRLGRADAERHGMVRLRAGLSALVEHLGLDNRGG